MTPFKCYKLYLALKRHFTDEKYDFFKYKGKIKANEASFEARKDRGLFHTLAKHDNPIQLALANLANNPNAYVTDLLSEEGQQAERRFAKYHQSFEYSFKEEIKRYPRFDDAIKVVDGQYPTLVQDFIAKEISLDTISVVDKVIWGSEYWSSQLTDPLWVDLNRQLLKYRPFFDISIQKYKNIILGIYEK